MQWRKGGSEGVGKGGGKEGGKERGREGRREGGMKRGREGVRGYRERGKGGRDDGRKEEGMKGGRRGRGRRGGEEGSKGRRKEKRESRKGEREGGREERKEKRGINLVHIMKGNCARHTRLDIVHEPTATTLTLTRGRGHLRWQGPFSTCLSVATHAVDSEEVLIVWVNIKKVFAILIGSFLCNRRLLDMRGRVRFLDTFGAWFRRTRRERWCFGQRWQVFVINLFAS